MGAWIEIGLNLSVISFGIRSLPLWERGLKSGHLGEMDMPGTVAPLVGAWIEMSSAHASSSKNLSLPLWERGLKFFFKATSRTSSAVAPLVGAWIEIPLVT